MIDTSFLRDIPGGFTDNSGNWHNPTGATAGSLVFTGTADTLVKVKVGSATGFAAHDTEPLHAHQRSEIEFDYEGTYPSLVLADGPVVYWRFGETGGSLTAADSSGFGHAGTNTSASFGQPSLLVNDSDGSCLFATSSTNRVSRSDETDLDTASLTAECWVLWNSLPSGTERRWLMSKWDAANLRGWILEYANGTGWRAAVQNSATFTSVTYNVAADTSNHHVAMTYDGTTLRLYVDGVSRGTPATTTSGPLPNTGAAYQVGGFANTAAFGSGAYVDEPAIYGSALTAARILAHYNAGVTGGSPATQAHLGCFCRYVDASNYVALKVSQIDPRNCTLVERVAGVDTVLATLTPATPAKSRGAIRLECVGRRARAWFESQCSYVRDRPPDVSVNLSRLSAAGSWGITMSANADGTTMRITRFRARDMAASLPPPPHFTVADASGLYNLVPLNVSVAGVGTVRELEWEVCPADGDDYPEKITRVTPPSAGSVVFLVGPGYAYDCRVREVNYDGTFGDWTDWLRVTVSGSKPAVTLPSLPAVPFPQNFGASYPLPRTHAGSVVASVADAGRECRVASWGRPRASFTLNYEFSTTAEMLALVNFFNEMKAREGAFKWQHPQSGTWYAMRFASDQIRWDGAGHAFKDANFPDGDPLARCSVDIEEIIYNGAGTVSATQTLDSSLYDGAPPVHELMSRPLSSPQRAASANNRGAAQVKPLT